MSGELLDFYFEIFDVLFFAFPKGALPVSSECAAVGSFGGVTDAARF